MWITLLAMGQAATTTPPAVIDLLAPIRPLRCPERPEEIVVCGARPGDEQRVFHRERPAEAVPPRAETRLFGNARGSIDAEAATLPGGVQSNRLMFRLKTPF